MMSPKYIQLIRRAFYVVAGALWVVAFGESAIGHPCVVSASIGLPFWLFFWPILVGLLAMAIWPSKASWWFLAGAWLLFGFFAASTWFRLNLGYEDVGKLDVGSARKHLILFILEILILTIAAHIVVGWPFLRSNKKHSPES